MAKSSSSGAQRPKNTARKPSPAFEATAKAASPADTGGIHASNGLFIPTAALIALTLLTFRAVSGFDFVSWDDNIHVYDNHYILAGWSGLGYFWMHPYEALYIPVAYTVFSLIASVAHILPGMRPDSMLTPIFDPHIFHLANLLLHTLSVIAVFTLLRLLVRQPVAAAFGAAIFAVHPLQIESVAWISELRGLLSGLLCLLSLIAYVKSTALADDAPDRRPSAGWYAAALALYATALLCKPSAATLALVMVCLRVGWGNARWRTAILEAAPFVLVALPIAWVSTSVQGSPYGAVVPIWDRPLVAADALAFYMAKVVAPIGLAIDYGRKPTIVVAHAWGYLTWIAPAVAAAVAVRYRKIFPAGAIGLAIAAILLLPVLGLAPFVYQGYSTVADRYMYLPLLGIALIVAAALARLDSGPRRRLAYGLATVTVAALATLSIVHVRVWRNSVALYTAALDANPRAYSAPTNLGAFYIMTGQTAKAVAPLQLAVRNDPDDVMSMVNLADSYRYLNRTGDAEATYRQALALSPGDTHALFGLGNVLVQEGKTADAVPEFQAALDADPTLLQATAQLGECYTRLKEYDRAISTYKSGLVIAPNSAYCWSGLAGVYMRMGRHADAVDALEQVKKFGPSSPVLDRFLAEQEAAEKSAH